MRLLALVGDSSPVTFVFKDGTKVKGYIAKADLDPLTRSGRLLLVAPERNMIVPTDAGDLVAITS
jgi:hypothetical protein